MGEEKPSPENQLSTVDTGDDTQRRFRCQAAYAATLSLDLLDPASEFEELFCEHHEDILIRKKDKSFIGIQVKTRESGREPFKANDPEVINALKRFVEQQIQYPDHYSRFVLATNYAFWTAKKDRQNLKHLLQSVQTVSSDGPSQLSSILSQYVNRLVGEIDKKLRPQATTDTVLRVLSKTGVEDTLPKFDDIETALINCVPEYYQHSGAGFDDLLRACRALIAKMFETASLAHTSPRSSYFSLLSNPAQSAVDVVIEGKRVTKEKIQSILTELLSKETLLTTVAPISISDLPRGMRAMELKMAKGKISAENIHHSKDHKYSADILFDGWIYKYGVNKATAQYKQLSVIVANECQEVYDELSGERKLFGQDMLIAVRERLRARYTNEPDSFFGCKYEHVLGVMGILTELCEVWWSKKFEIPEEAVV